MAPADDKSSVWVPVCCGRIMRYNTFRQPRGGAYGAFVCTSCSKNIVLEQEPLSSMSTYGEGSILLSVVGSPKPPLARRAGGDIGSDDPTL
jgi:hypothetical protein